jgi:hypothetical protein
MIIRKATLAKVASGEVTLAFRKWRRATVKSGGRLRTSVGELAIGAVSVVTPEVITDAEARASGFEDRGALLDYLSGDRDGDLYRIELSLAGPDPRTALRERATLTDEEFSSIRKRLSRLDAASTRGPWTERYLRMIAERPDVLALDLAESIGMERAPFKINVRKLKELGLTESRRPGYRLSPCGRAFLERIDREARD